MRWGNHSNKTYVVDNWTRSLYLHNHWYPGHHVIIFLYTIMTCIVTQSRYMYTDPQRYDDTTLAPDMHARLLTTWYYMIPRLPLLQVLVLRIYVTRILLVHRQVPHIILSSSSLHGYGSSRYLILDTAHWYCLYMLHRYYDTSHQLLICTTSQTTAISYIVIIII